MKKTDFSEIYKRADWYDQMHLDYNDDVAFYTGLARDIGGPILELACGTGRITIPIAEQGNEIWGMDITESMLERAKMKLKEKNLTVRLIHEDIRDFRLNKKFRLIIFPFSAIAHIHERREIGSLARSVYEHLDSGGVFAFDYFNPSLKILTRDPDEFFHSHEFIDTDSGRKITITERTRYDAATQLNNILWRYEIEGERKTIDREWSVRIFYPQELDYILETAGLKIEHKYGWFDKTPFGSDSKRQIYICRKG